MTLTPEQQIIAESNMGLVGKVIRDKVRDIGRIYEYDDLFQIGCIGLCKAAATQKNGRFSTYAYRLIWNEICDELTRTSRRLSREETKAPEEINCVLHSRRADPQSSDMAYLAVRQAKEKAGGVIAKGIKSLELYASGYTSQEIGRIMGVKDANVRMWMTRARRHLKSLPELQEC